MEDINNNKKLYILLGVLLIIVFVIIINLIKSNLDMTIDYNSVKSGSDLIESANITYDRETYFILEGILDKFISSYNMEIENDVPDSENAITYEDYYDVLSKSYRSRLSKNKYKEIAKNFLERFVYLDESGMDSMQMVISTNVIRGIYKLGDNKYICAVGLNSATSYGYIGISVNPFKNTYEIFYLE